MLVEGGKNEVRLNAPKGMALRGDTLFVADIDMLRMFNRRTGAPIGAVSLRENNATFLNAITTYGLATPFFEKRSTFRFTIGRTF